MLLFDLPNEIIILIAKFIDDKRSLDALAKTNRSLYPVANEVLYIRNARHERSSAIVWGAENAVTGTVLMALDFGANINAMDPIRRTPLHIAAEQGNLELIKILLGRGADTNVPDRNGYTPLFWTIKGRDIEFARLLLKHNANPNWACIDGWSPIHTASIGDDFVRLLLEYGANPGAKDRFGNTPLNIAVNTGPEQEIVVRLLLQAGASTEVMDRRGQRPLTKAVLRHHLGLVRLLLSHGADITAPINTTEDTLLHMAVEKSTFEMVRLLLHHGPRADFVNQYMETPLHLAARKGRKDMAQILLEYGAQVNLKNIDGDTPLILAACTSHGPLVELLLQNDSDPIYREFFSRTSLCDYGSPQAIELLEQRGLSGTRLAQLAQRKVRSC
ncbi:hypothetical protein N7462_006468 [Penicillium macrosclerotiorum]|uniref:uncharacterized protein n=1 Tax=Penicillium macrosclerotiorum TaxID=303699 RepID=UPI0025479EDC|nr:uncharacterized protein N7462_006468 [Penicillium macrosclerotiorum]KAJ5683303.1 hypothetical protein N7462_006468 [Penicillium macrosclerotiorum]